MNDVTSHINKCAEISAVEITDTEGVVYDEFAPVLATPAAFMAGVAIASATVAAFEAGQG
ncbi:MAG TPA: hypothetical protein VGO89_15695 [Streptomyces sp.]|jgi:hypothetical protein|nr:hypothetical protein [Streptomyces sp.]